MFSARQGFYISSSTTMLGGAIIRITDIGNPVGGQISDIALDSSGNVYAISATHNGIIKFSPTDGGILWQTQPSNPNIFGPIKLINYNGEMIIGALVGGSGAMATGNQNINSGAVSSTYNLYTIAAGYDKSDFLINSSGTRYFTGSAKILRYNPGLTSITERTLSAFGGTTNRSSNNILFNSSTNQFIISGRCDVSGSAYAPYLVVTPDTFTGSTIKYLLFGTPSTDQKTFTGITIGSGNNINIVGNDTNTGFYLIVSSSGTSITFQRTISGIRLLGCTSDGTFTYIYGGYNDSTAIYVACLDSLGNRVWERRISCSEYPTTFFPVNYGNIILNGGYLYFMGSGQDSIDSYQNKGYIFKMKSDGSTLGSFAGDAGTFTFSATTRTYTTSAYTATIGTPTFTTATVTATSISPTWVAGANTSTVTTL